MPSHLRQKFRKPFDAASIFHAALGEESWEEVLRAYSGAMDAVVFLGYPNPSKPGGFEARAHRYDFGVFEHGPIMYHEQWNPKINPFVEPMIRARPCHGIDRREIISNRDGERNAFLRQVALAQNIYHSRYASIASREGGFAGIWIGQSKSDGPIEGDQRKAFEASLRYFQLAFRTCGMIGVRDTAITNLQLAIDRLHHGFIALNSDMRIIFRNRAAQEIIEDGDGISERAGVLHFHSAKNQSAASAMVQAIAHRRDLSEHQAMVVRRPSLLPPYRATFAPSEGMGPGLGAATSVAILTLHDPMLTKTPQSARLLADQYGLTLAEARATRLAALGLTKSQIGSALGVSENTVRTQLASAREKVGAANLAQLAFMIG